MATINKRQDQDGNARFQVIVRLKGFATQSATFTRLTDAKKWAQNTESAIREGRHFKSSEAKKHTLGDMIDRYIELFNPPLYKKAQLAWWKEKLGRRVLCDITPAMIASGRDALVEGITKKGTQRSPSTAVCYIAFELSARRATRHRTICFFCHDFRLLLPDVEKQPFYTCESLTSAIKIRT